MDDTRKFVLFPETFRLLSPPIRTEYDDESSSSDDDDDSSPDVSSPDDTSCTSSSSLVSSSSSFSFSISPLKV